MTSPLFLDGPDGPQMSLGEAGERLAAEHLVNLGYRIVVTNFKVPVGRNSKGVSVTGEIDLIAMDGDVLCFIEVKTRRSDDFTPVITAINTRKQRQIVRTARVYRRIFAIADVTFRYDAVTILMPNDAEPTIEVSKAFWNESVFKKKKWDQMRWFDFV